MQHHEAQAAQQQHLALARHAAEFMRDQPAYGVENLIRVAGAQRHLEGLGHALHGGFAAHAVAVVGQAEDVALVLVDVELVLDLADDLLDHILEGDQAGDAAELVDDDGHVVARAAKFALQRLQCCREIRNA